MTASVGRGRLVVAKFVPDGSLTIAISHAPPADAVARANWLPAPDGQFVLIVRVYAASDPRPCEWHITTHYLAAEVAELIAAVSKIEGGESAPVMTLIRASDMGQ